MKQVDRLSIGDKFDYWTVISVVINVAGTNGGRSQSKYYCRCVCGTERLVTPFALTTGRSRSCGCANQFYRICANNDLALRGSVKIGNVYGLLSVIGNPSPMPSEGVKSRMRWSAMCLCECGNISFPDVYNLISKGTLSCGCLNRSITSNRHALNHCGNHWTKEPMYHIWTNIKDRCFNANSWSYFYYGARGITICDEWNNSFPVFRDWSYANGYQAGLSIDRIDSSKNYCPENCRWVTRSENSKNCSFVKKLTAFGETKSMSAWARDARCEVSLGTLWHRLNKMGMSEQDAVATPRGTRSAQTGKFALKP